MQLGTSLKENDLCKSVGSVLSTLLNLSSRRTYGQNIGEDIREGYEPTEGSGIDQEDGAADPFSVGGDDDDDADDDHAVAGPDDSEESQQWKQSQEPAVLLPPKYGVNGEAFENVWDAGDSSRPAQENP